MMVLVAYDVRTDSEKGPKRLRRVGFVVDDLRVLARPGGKMKHTIWIAVRPGERGQKLS